MTTTTFPAMVFVPAMMSVGLLFSILTLLRDAVRWSGTRTRRRRAAIEARAVVGDVLGESHPPPNEMGVLSRSSYLISALVLTAGSAYVAIGSTANFLRDGGYVSDIAWLLALSLGLATILGFLGGVSVVVFWRWPNPPPWTLGPLRNSPLTTTPGSTATGPSWELTASAAVTAVALGMLTLMVGTGRGFALEIDRPILDWLVETEWLSRLGPIDPFGSTIISIGFFALVGMSGFRCRVMALVFPFAFVASWSLTLALQEIIERPRPIGLGELESFPSGHMVQAVLIAGLVPLALGVLLSDQRAAILSRSVLGVAVVGTALHRVHRQNHWPLDALAGALLGVAVVLAVHWILEHKVWHLRCQTCPWSAHPGHTPWQEGVFKLSPTATARIGRAGIGLGFGAAALLAIGTLTIGLPTDPEGAGLGSAVFGPLQIGFATLIGVAALTAIRWKGPAAFLMAFCAAGLGVAASVEYSPVLTFLLAAALLIPSVLIWLAWQPNETVGSIAVLAVVTVTALTGTVFGSREVYGHYFGPSHPESVSPTLGSAAEWLWIGDVGPNSATIVAGGLDQASPVQLRHWSDSPGGPTTHILALSDAQGIARFELTNLSPNTAVSYQITVGTDADNLAQRADATFHTHAQGPQDLTVVLGSCARRGSNGAVFDAMVAAEPDLYLALGDLHYGNLESADPADHIAEYGRSLGQPAQAALFSSVPTAYVWDDHDYGPNDAGASSPSRLAVSSAYRQAVPHHGVDPDPQQSIEQAFTVGRVRFILSDTRSQRTDTTMLGHEQRDWLIEEIIASSSSHALVVWANPTPWVSDEGEGADDWSAHPDEREFIANALADAGVTNLIMVSGDAHMVAIDDGSNTGYASDGSKGFPLIHAAALDRPGSVKGGPYSEGAVPGGGQFGKLDVFDDGGPEIRVRLSGHTWDEREIISWEHTIAVG